MRLKSLLDRILAYRATYKTKLAKPMLLDKSSYLQFLLTYETF